MVTLHLQRLIGLVFVNDNSIITLADPCIINVKKVEDKDKNTLHFITDMLPYRIVGDDNFATFNYNNLSNISIVSSEKFISM